MPAVSLNNIVKTYDNGKVKATLTMFLFNVENRELFGLIGPDGTGKTSIGYSQHCFWLIKDRLVLERT